MVNLPVTVQSLANATKSIGCIVGRPYSLSAAFRYRTFVPGGSRSVVDLERPVGDLDQDPAGLDDDLVDRQRELGGRIQRLAALEIEP